MYLCISIVIMRGFIYRNFLFRNKKKPKIFFQTFGFFFLKTCCLFKGGGKKFVQYGGLMTDANPLGQLLINYTNDDATTGNITDHERVELPEKSSAPPSEMVEIIQAMDSKTLNTIQLLQKENANLCADIMCAPLQGPLLPHQVKMFLKKKVKRGI